MMACKRCVWLLLMVSLMQCVGDKKPEGVLDQEDMVDLMVEVYLAEAKITGARISRDSSMQLFSPYENSIISQKGLYDSVLRVSYKYYLQKPKELEEILDAVIDTLNLREQRASGQP